MDHGFGKGTVSSEAPSDATIRGIAEQIRKIPGLKRAHVVRPYPKYKPPRKCDIIFEFDYPHPHGWESLDDLLKAIEAVGVNGHKIRIDEVWIIQENHEKKK